MAQASPHVSVVIPVYNSMPYLTGMMDSLLAQELENFEIIAINDGSTDGSGAELDRFASLDQRVSVIHQENSGWPGMPRNRGLERSRGEFVMFMDADDTIAPDALRRMVDQAERHDADVVIPRFEGTGGRQVQSLFLRHPEGPIQLERAMETLSPQKLFRREMLERGNVRFPEGRVRLEDGIFVTRAYLLARRIMFCGADPLYFIALRDDGGNISGQAIDPDNYVASCRQIATLLLEGVPDTARAHTLVRQFFSRKGLRFYAPKRWMRMDANRKRTWVSLHQAFLRDLLPASQDARVSHPSDRRKFELIRAGDIEGLDTFISGAARLAHHPRVIEVRAIRNGLEVTVELEPVTGDSPLRGASGGLRVRIADRLYRSLRSRVTQRFVRGATRRAARVIAGGTVGATLMLSGRKKSRPVTVPGRIAPAISPDGTARRDSAPRFRFVLPFTLLQRYGGDRVDCWTVARAAHGVSGDRQRLAAAPDFSHRSAEVRAYATNRGNFSLQVHPKSSLQ